MAELEISWSLRSVRAYRHVPLAEKMPNSHFEISFLGLKVLPGPGPSLACTIFMYVAKQGVALKVGFG